MRARLSGLFGILIFGSALLISDIGLSDGVPKKQNKKPQPKPIKLTGKLTTSDPYDYIRSSSYHKVHEVKLQGDALYTIAMTAGFANAHLRVEDFRGNQVAFTNTNVGIANRLALQFTPSETETYRVVVTSNSSRQTGNYTIDIKPQVPVLFIKGALAKTDPFDPGRPAGHHHKIHKVKLVPGNTYTIHASTTVHDGWLRLEDSKKTRISENDDFMNTRNSRLVFTPTKADTYRIVITTYSAGSVGPYTLTITK